MMWLWRWRFIIYAAGIVSIMIDAIDELHGWNYFPVPVTAVAGLLIILALVTSYIGAAVNLRSSRISGRVMAVAVVIVVAVIVGFSVLPAIFHSSVSFTTPGQNTPPVILQTVMPKGAVFAYSPNGTITTVNAKSSTIYGMVYSGIEINITNNTQLVCSWTSTTPVSAIIVPLQYMHNVSVLGKVLSIETPSSSGKMDYSFGTAANVSSITFMLMFFPAPGQSGTVTFTTALVLETA